MNTLGAGLERSRWVVCLGLEKAAALMADNVSGFTTRRSRLQRTAGAAFKGRRPFHHLRASRTQSENSQLTTGLTSANRP